MAKIGSQRDFETTCNKFPSRRPLNSPAFAGGGPALLDKVMDVVTGAIDKRELAGTIADTSIEQSKGGGQKEWDSNEL